MKNIIKTIFFSTLLVSGLILAAGVEGARAQQTGGGNDDITQTREIKSEDFTVKRPVTTRVKKPGTIPIKPGVIKNRIYKLRRKQATRRPKPPVQTNPKIDTTTKTSSAENLKLEQLGVTVWQLRPERSSDTGARLLTRNKSSLTGERVSLDNTFHAGDKIRLSIESPRAGYLYIIDRELRQDNSLGDASLIFPTLTTRSGDNYLTAGAPVEIPAQSDDPFYFDITPTDKNYAGEMITVLVSPFKLPNLKLNDDPLVLKNELIEQWETDWEKAASIFELDKDKESQEYTEEEKEAGIGNRQLTRNSPPPQTMFALKAPGDQPFLINFVIKVSN